MCSNNHAGGASLLQEEISTHQTSVEMNNNPRRLIIIMHSNTQTQRMSNYCIFHHIKSLTVHLLFLCYFLYTALPPPPHPSNPPSNPPSKNPSNSPDSTASRPDIRDLKSSSPPKSKPRLVSPTPPLMMPSLPPITHSTATTS